MKSMGPIDATDPTSSLASLQAMSAPAYSNLGILVFTSTLQLVFMNQQAVHLAGRINETQTGLKAKGVIPGEVLTLCREILKAMLIKTDAKGWEDFQLIKVVGSPLHSIFLRGFPLVDPAGIAQSHILIFLEEALLPKGLSLEQIKVYFQLTEREQAVVQSLCKGLTNKEIAVELGIAEQTVKEHVKNIMAKTGVTTRTGILAIALRAFSGSFSNGSQSFKQIGKTCPGDQENGQKRVPEDLNQERKDGADSNVTTTA